jgi:hypothetical protein
MLKYFIVHSDASSDGRAQRNLDVDYLQMPNETSPLLQFYRRGTGAEYVMIFAINPANIMTLELVEGIPISNGRNIYDEAQGPPEITD